MIQPFAQPCCARLRPSSMAFTLIELLVVLGIITVTAGILLPTLGKAREQGRLAQCLSNQRQQGQFAHTYMADFRDYMFPSDFDLTTGFRSWQLYAQQVYDWGRQEMFRCPSIPEQGHFDPSGIAAGTADFIGISYVMNTMRPNEWSQGVAPDAAIRIPRPDRAKGWTGIDPGGPLTHSWEYPLRVANVKRPLSQAIHIVDHRPTYAPDMLHGSVTQAFTHGIYRFGESDHATARDTQIGTPRMKVGVRVHGNERFNVLYGDGHGQSVARTDPTHWVVKIGR